MFRKKNRGKQYILGLLVFGKQRVEEKKKKTRERVFKPEREKEMGRRKENGRRREGEMAADERKIATKAR